MLAGAPFLIDFHVHFADDPDSLAAAAVTRNVFQRREGIGRNVKMQMTVNMNENELYKMTTRRTVTNCLLRSEMVAL